MCPVTLDVFSPAVRAWFDATFDEPTPAQREGWDAIARGDHTLILAPTGSGKTLAAFLWAIDRLADRAAARRRTSAPASSTSRRSARSPSTSRRTCARPLAGIEHAADRAGRRRSRTSRRWASAPATRPPNERRQMLKRPPDILITTPESLYLMLTSQARETLRSVRWVIVDEIHAMAATKRGAHLAISLERLERLTEARRRNGSACRRRSGRSRDRAVPRRPRRRRRAAARDDRRRRPSQADGARGDRPGRGHGRARRCRRHAGPAPTLLGPSTDGRSPSTASIWPAIHPRLLELIRAHRSTIVFVNARRMAERLAAQLNELADEDLVRAHHGSLAREQRLEVEDALKAGTPARDRRHVAASSSASTWAPSTWWSRWSRRARSRAACSASAAPATRSASPAAARSSRSSAATCWRRAW